ncbi:hypothetical protein [Vibrio atlanticus]|uniref:hypothetical protein n=1 Tax=Vibrio atlanticus TaxID=693153 RepID=UPI003D0C83DA
MTANSTEAQLRDALNRLIMRRPITKANLLKVQAGKPLKITNSSVEKEAGKGNGALRHYPKLREDIETAEAERVYSSSNPSDISSGSSEKITIEEVKSSPIYKKIQEELAKEVSARKSAEADVLDLKEECARKDAALNEKSAELDEVIASMWELIPRDSQRTVLIQKLNKVISFNEYK